MTNGQWTQIKERLWLEHGLWRFTHKNQPDGSCIIRSPIVTIGYVECVPNTASVSGGLIIRLTTPYPTGDEKAIAEWRQQRQQLEQVMKITRVVLEKRLVMERRP